MAELLVELLSEEIPAALQVKSATEFANLIAKGLKSENLKFSTIQSYSTPRRLSVVIDGLPLKQDDITDARKGPKIDAPEQAIAGFLRGAGIESLDQCEKRDTPKGQVWYAIIERKGKETAAILPDIITNAIKAITWAKPMRFSDFNFKWVRPLHNIAAIFNGDIIDGAIHMQSQAINKAAKITFNNKTCGHRFLSNGAIEFNDFKQYQQKLTDNYVMLDHGQRVTTIAKQLEQAANDQNLLLQQDDRLLNEVAGLVEWPVVLIGDIDQVFMEIPREALTSSMREHQKYFSLNNKDGTMAAKFAVVANIITNDNGAAIINGNQRVLRARLSDAKFFWQQDINQKLDDFIPKLDKVVFHKKLGTLGARVVRISKISQEISRYIPDAKPELAARAAELAKADLVSAMVNEFADLQGIMGKYYAINQGEDMAVANAIAEHYSPKGPSDICPSAPISVAVALAEKFDILAGFWLIDEKPTGSKDPFALRRAALGIIRLILENNLHLPLNAIFTKAFNGFDQDIKDQDKSKIDNAAIIDDILNFFGERLKTHLKGEGVKHDHVAAVFATGGGDDDLCRLLARVNALSDFIENDDGANLLVGYKRGNNILRAEEKKDKRQFNGNVDVDKFTTNEEKTLYDILKIAAAISSKKAEKEDFKGAMKAFSALRRPMDVFFENVMVNQQDERENRLNLLANIRDVMNELAVFSLIEG